MKTWSLFEMSKLTGYYVTTYYIYYTWKPSSEFLFSKCPMVAVEGRRAKIPRLKTAEKQTIAHTYTHMYIYTHAHP